MTEQTPPARAIPMAGMPADEAVRYCVMIQERDRALQLASVLRAENAQLRAALGLASNG